MGYIYKITNIINNKSYVGYTTNPKARWVAHRHNQGSKLVHQAIKKYGLNKFTFKVIAEDTVENEQQYINEHNTMAPNGYNLTEGGSLPPNHKGKTYKEIYGADWKQQVQKRRLKQIARGGHGPIAHTEETKKKISKATKGKNNPMYGKTQSSHTRKLISESKKGKGVGSRNPNAKQWVLISPEGKKYHIEGTLKEKCLDLGLSYATIHASHLYNRPMRSGWQVYTK